MDRLIVTKAFIDEARGGTDWYRAENLSTCFTTEDLDAFIIPLFGQGGSKPTPDDAQFGVGSDYDNWIRRAVPLANDLASALALRKGVSATVLNLNGRKDIGDFRHIDWTAVDVGPDPTDTFGTTFFQQAPNIWRLGSRQ